MDLKISPTKEVFENLAQTYNLIPVYTEVPCDLDTPISLFYKLGEGKRYAFLLESLEGGEKWARYSFIGIDPYLVFKSKGQQVWLFERQNEGLILKDNFFSANPFNELRKLIKGVDCALVDGLPRFFGGAVGFIGYETVRFFEKIPVGEEILGFSDLHFMFPEVVLVYDRFKHALKIVYNVRIDQKETVSKVYQEAVAKVCEIKDLIFFSKIVYQPFEITSIASPQPEITKEKFCSMVERAKKYIEEGDIIQVVLSQRFSFKSQVPPFLFYRALRKVNPSPYLFFLKLDDEVLIGSSPEILVRMEGSLVETRPIAGTRKRGKTEQEDKELEKDLKGDKKELAEHIMLVDLGRNDLGRICKYGTVEVYELMVVERYSHVMHLVSGVKGEVIPGLDMFDVFAATFPAGTVSGAPKIRAMEIIAEIEKKERGPYAGAVGYFGFSGNMDFCITIRTIFQKGEVCYLQAGAGIVADSDPEKEYEETLNKAKAMFKAIEILRELV